MSPRNRKTASIIAKTTELALAAPQVVAHRMLRIAIAGPILSERDQVEFQLMSDEKTAAFSDSWNAMFMQAFHANQSLALYFMRSFWSPWKLDKRSANAVTAKIQNAAMSVLDKGIVPVHRKAVANAKRLARTSIR